jgi:hypothetical protein
MNLDEILKKAGITGEHRAEITDNYKVVDDMASKRVFSGARHVDGTLKIAEKLFSVLGDYIDEHTQELALLAVALHDCGKDERPQKDGHCERGGELACKYLAGTDMNDEDKQKVIAAVRDHEKEGNKEVISAIVKFVDELHTTKDRVKAMGCNIVLEHILSVEFGLSDDGKTLNVEQICDDDFSIDEWDEMGRQRIGVGNIEKLGHDIKSFSKLLELQSHWVMGGRDMEIKQRELNSSKNIDLSFGSYL